MNNKQVQTTNQELVGNKTKKLILEKTPAQYVKRRQGRGGKMLDYVETGYVIKKLNDVFNYMWSFEVIEEKIGTGQIYVKGKLTAHLAPDIAITKVQYGGAEIKKDKQTQKPIDIGDDMKAASSDALKKCASLFGIAQDIFWPSGTEFVQDTEEAAPSEPAAPQNTHVDDDGVTHEPVQTKAVLEHFCAIHKKELKERLFNGKRWFDHRWQDEGGVWQRCYGKPVQKPVQEEEFTADQIVEDAAEYLG